MDNILIVPKLQININLKTKKEEIYSLKNIQESDAHNSIILQH